MKEDRGKWLRNMFPEGIRLGDIVDLYLEYCINKTTSKEKALRRAELKTLTNLMVHLN